MAAILKTSPFALRDLPPPEEWHKRKVALISGQLLSLRFAARLTLVFVQVSPARMDHICSCLDLARVTLIIEPYFSSQDRATPREGLSGARHHSSLL